MNNKNVPTIQFVGVDPDEYLGRLSKLIDDKLNKHLKDFKIKSDERVLTKKETAKYLGINPLTLYRWDKSNILKPYRIGKTVRYKVSEILKSERLPLKYKGRILQSPYGR